MLKKLEIPVWFYLCMCWYIYYTCSFFKGKIINIIQNPFAFSRVDKEMTFSVWVFYSGIKCRNSVQNWRIVISQFEFHVFITVFFQGVFNNNVICILALSTSIITWCVTVNYYFWFVFRKSSYKLFNTCLLYTSMP